MPATPGRRFDGQPDNAAPPGGGVTAAAVTEPVPVRVQLPGRAEFPQVFHLCWAADQPTWAALAAGRHPDTGEPVLWWFDPALLARGLRQPAVDAAGGMLAELEVNDPRWLLLSRTVPGAESTVLMPVAHVQRFLHGLAAAQAAAVDIDALAGQLLGAGADTGPARPDMERESELSRPVRRPAGGAV